MKLKSRKAIELGALILVALLFWMNVSISRLSTGDSEKLRPTMTIEEIRTVLCQRELPPGAGLMGNARLPKWRNSWDVSDGYIFVDWAGDNYFYVSTVKYPQWKKWRDKISMKIGW
jgi:hypothetical protein